MTDKTSHTVSVGVILALFLTVLVMRGPITGIGAVADELMAVRVLRLFVRPADCLFRLVLRGSTTIDRSVWRQWGGDRLFGDDSDWSGG